MAATNRKAEATATQLSLAIFVTIILLQKYIISVTGFFPIRRLPLSPLHINFQYILSTVQKDKKKENGPVDDRQQGRPKAARARLCGAFSRFRGRAE
jgi:hypothetical protein